MFKHQSFHIAALVVSVMTLTACGDTTLSASWDPSSQSAAQGTEDSNTTETAICNPIDGQIEGCDDTNNDNPGGGENPGPEDDANPNNPNGDDDPNGGNPSLSNPGTTGGPTSDDCSNNREVCDGQDNDCDGDVDENVTNACGGCGSVPVEMCDNEDNDCDGSVDEGVACGDSCDPETTETCDGDDNDCDGEVDEGVTNACGGCGSVPAEICNGDDDDCDGSIGEGVTNACGTCGDVPEEVCDGEDNDCDGEIDEGFDANNNGTADCQEPVCITIDFETDAAGNPVVAGQDVSNAYADWGVRIALFDDASSNAPVPATIFDSSNPTGGDWDLGTPNAQYGGPGRGDSGASNDRAMGNVLIVPENTDDANNDGLIDEPDDFAGASWYKFFFDEPVCLVSFDYVDGEEATHVQLFDINGDVIAEFHPGGQGNNSVETVHLNTCDVSMLLIDMGGSGAVDNIKICPPENVCENDEFTQFNATAAANHAVIVSSFEEEGDRVVLHFQDNGRFTVNNDGTATLTGTVAVTRGASVGQQWQFAAEFAYLGQGEDSGATPKVEQPALQPESITALWEYYRLVEGSLTRADSTIVLSERPDTGEHPFQVGDAANNKNANYGGSFWFHTFRTNAGSDAVLQGHGDVNINLDPVCE